MRCVPSIVLLAVFSGVVLTGLPMNFTSILQLNAFMESHFAREWNTTVYKNTLTLGEWNAALPTTEERAEMAKLIGELYEMADFSDLDPQKTLSNFPVLNRSIDLTVLKQGQYCVVHERVPPNDQRFPRFFGYAVLQGRKNAKRLLHHSAAHFESDGNVCNQSATLFERTQSRSLVVAGASRFAVNGHNPSPCQKWNQVADAAHNNETMFYAINSAIFAAATEYAKSISSAFTDVFIEWHGMAETSCPKAPIYISAAYNASAAVYNDTQSSVGRLYNAVKQVERGDFRAEMPSTSYCNLVATTNIFARIVNGVSPDLVCHHNPKPKNVKGHFISVEQKRVPRNDWDTWTKVLQNGFPEDSSKSATAAESGIVTILIALTLTRF